MTVKPAPNRDWEAALDDLRGRVSSESFATWLAPIRCDSFDGKRLILRIPNRFYGEWIRAHYLDLLVESLREQRVGVAETVEIDWNVDETLEPKPEPAAARQSAPPPDVQAHAPGAAPDTSDLNPRYRFETFIVGPSNELAHAAAIAAASSPGQRYNPLFLYGGVGLGKTHLVNAIGHRVRAARPDVRILYVSAERFTNEFIWSLQNHRISEFRDRYRRQCDVLLMDDVQFLASREQTQEEFFHTFDALYHSDKQIVVSSDATPHQMGKLQDRLVSRFQCGLVADIQAPELDTRTAIVRKKAEQEGIDLPDDVAHFLAEVSRSNVRELEGSLLRLAMSAEVMRRPIDLDLARETLHPSTVSVTRGLTVDDIQQAVCDHFNIRLSDLKSHRRHRSVTHARLVAMYLCRQRLRASYNEIGERFGGKDHTTVMSGVKAIQARAASDEDLRESLDLLASRLDQR